jgi:hypothetical protein
MICRYQDNDRCENFLRIPATLVVSRAQTIVASSTSCLRIRFETLNNYKPAPKKPIGRCKRLHLNLTQSLSATVRAPSHRLLVDKHKPTDGVEKNEYKKKQIVNSCLVTIPRASTDMLTVPGKRLICKA